MTVGTGTMYTLTQAEVGKTLTVTATYTDGGNAAESVTSAVTAAIANINDAPTGSVMISGTPTQGQTLTATNTLVDPDGLGAITYTWKAGGTTIGTSATYTLTQAEVGKTVTVTASYTDGGNTVESVISAATAAVDASAVNAAPVFLAPGGGTGKVFMPVGAGSDIANSAFIQPDGKIVVSGYSENGSKINFSLVRLNPSGSFDTSFDGDGKLLLSVSGRGDYAKSALLQPDGKIIVVGWGSNGTNNDFSLARLNPNGSLDTSFDGDGKLLLAVGVGDDIANSAFVQVDEKIVVVGYSQNGANYDFSLVRLNPDGSLDTTFDGDGKLLLPVGVSNDTALTAFIQTDEKIVVTGYSYYGSNTDFSLIRLNANGSLDTSFGSDGKLLLGIGTQNDHAYDTILQPDGKIVVAGYSRNGSNDDFSLARLNSNGSLDTSFDGDGKLLLPVGTVWDYATSALVQPDGKIVVVGSSLGTSNFDFSLARLNSNGSLDTSFDSDGKLLLPVGTDHDEAWSALLQPDGKIVVAGYSMNGSTNDFSLVRLDADGSLDKTFGATRTNNLTLSVAYTENANATSLGDSISIADPDLSVLGGGQGNYAGASVTLARQGGADAQDIFSALGNLVFSNGNAVLYGTTVGTVTQGSGSLTIAFNANATQARVDEVLSSLAYANTGDAPPATVMLAWTFSDGNTGSQGSGGALAATGSTIVSITAINDAPAGSVTISGTATQGQTLTALNTLADADGLGAITYTWMASGATVGIGATYTLKQSDVGKAITVTASYTDGGGTAESVKSAATAAVANVDDESTGTLGVSGHAKEGSVLTASLSNVVDADGATTTAYQWQRLVGSAWASLSSGQGSTLLIPSDGSLAGKQVRVVATTTDVLGGTTEFNSESLLVQAAGVPVNVEVRAWKTLDVLPNVEVAIGSPKQATDAVGMARFTSIVEPSIVVSATANPTSPPYSGGSISVTLQDAVSILKMIAGQTADATPASRFQSLAADFDGSGTVSLADALGVLRHAVGLQAPKPSWVFVEEGDNALPSILSPGIPGPVTVAVTPPGPIEVNLIGVLRGDVDGSYGVYGG